MSLQLAIPNKGALSEDSVRLLREAGYRCTRSGRELIVSDRENEIDFVFLRPRDIALYVGNGVLDLGITGRDLAADSGAQVTELMNLEFGRSRFCFAVPKNSGLTVETLNGLRIATSYPELLRKNLAQRGLSCPVVRLDGAVEISIRLGVADAIADVVESGATLREAGLEVIGEPMLVSEAILIGRSAELAERPAVRKLIARLKGILVAGAYAMVEYDIPRLQLEAACAITPGLESPTVSPLSNPDWVAVKAMVARKECNRIMDELYQIGARGIIVTDIRSCRL
ncbi:ATP phosphoribosyltransferase [uncultured Victivallis sp.]|uniref:ATP phosphoribosyltransferase n=1 Tax=Victivallis sp. TaxID=2049020 RepID=UPI0025F83D88|nr:ATP phosphoribosyltransferase [uncultured Victivallis sp.]